MMPPSQLKESIVILYVLFWVIRINGCIRRLRQPRLRGPEWFFNVHVQPGFYTGPGRRLLHRYWLRMLIPFAIDIPLATAIFMSGRLVLFNWLILGLSAIIHLNHSISVDIAERQAQLYAVVEDEKPVSSVALSLSPRRLRDYSSAALESLIVAAFAVCFVFVGRHYLGSSADHDLRTVVGVPVFLLYAQFGFLYAKTLVLAWRSPIPEHESEDHLKLREETRRYYVRVCDFNRAASAAAALFWPVLLNVPRERATQIAGVWFFAWLIVAVIATVWVEIKRYQLVTLSLRARPARLPDLLRERDIARWPVCYQPAAPLLIIRGARGYSLNLANSLARYGAAYVAGLAVLVVVLRKVH